MFDCNIISPYGFDMRLYSSAYFSEFKMYRSCGRVYDKHLTFNKLWNTLAEII